MRKSSALARRQQRNHARYRGRNDLNIVPMLDVMVILAFFLIFTAVFSKTSVLEVNLPGPGAQAAAETPRFELELILRKSGIEVADRNQGVLETIPAVASGQDVARLTSYLAALKAKVPEVSHATLLVAEDVDYDTIVQVMDAARARQTVNGGTVTREPLFPQIALGDAPT
jgi:biopolymer transport protein ExbD